jgi:hypothetical protein
MIWVNARIASRHDVSLTAAVGVGRASLDRRRQRVPGGLLAGSHSASPPPLRPDIRGPRNGAITHRRAAW